MSGCYGPMSRYLYYALFVIGIAFHKTEWLATSTLAADMLFSSIAAIHAIAMAPARGRGTLDLDVIPVFAITGVGMLVSTPMLIWSHTLRSASESLRMLVVLWIGLMFIGLIASMASLKTVHLSSPCQRDTSSENCTIPCNISLPMRDGQSVISVLFPWRSLLYDYSGWFCGCGATFTVLSLLYTVERQSPKEMARRVLNNDTLPRTNREKIAGKGLCTALLIPFLCLISVAGQIAITELIMMGHNHIPLGENMSAIGQWGPIVGAFFAIIGSLFKTLLDKKFNTR